MRICIKGMCIFAEAKFKNVYLNSLLNRTPLTCKCKCTLNKESNPLTGLKYISQKISHPTTKQQVALKILFKT